MWITLQGGKERVESDSSGGEGEIGPSIGLSRGEKSKSSENQRIVQLEEQQV